MKFNVLFLIVFTFFSLALFPQQCQLIEGGATYTQDSANAFKTLIVNDLQWAYEPDNHAFLLATGKVTAVIGTIDGIIGHNCCAEAQLLLMQGDTIVACYHPPRVQGLSRAEISFKHTFEVGDSYGPVNNLKLKARVYVYANFQKYALGDSIVKFTKEYTLPNPYSSSSYGIR